MPRVLVLNGPNVALVGLREPHLYGSTSLEAGMARLHERVAGTDVEVEVLTSNHEGELVDRIHRIVRARAAGTPDTDAVIINPGGATAYSVAVLDALAATELPIVVVHVANRAAKKGGEIRERDLVARISQGQIIGLGVTGYLLALDWCLEHVPALQVP